MVSKLDDRAKCRYKGFFFTRKILCFGNSDKLAIQFEVRSAFGIKRSSSNYEDTLLLAKKWRMYHPEIILRFIPFYKGEKPGLFPHDAVFTRFSKT